MDFFMFYGGVGVFVFAMILYQHFRMRREEKREKAQNKTTDQPNKTKQD